jgi:hypothetical protein
MQKIILSIFYTFFLVFFSCSSGDSVETNDDISPAGSIAMTTRIDGVDYNTPPQIGGNLAENSGGTAYGGTANYLLKGYKNLSSGKTIFRVGNKIYNIYLIIPKNNLSLGIHNFSSSFVLGEYFADLDIIGVVPAENVNTTSGFIKILSYDVSTKLLKGNFNFTTNDGIDLLNTSHVLVGTFEYKLP